MFSALQDLWPLGLVIYIKNVGLGGGGQNQHTTIQCDWKSPRRVHKADSCRSADNFAKKIKSKRKKRSREKKMASKKLRAEKLVRQRQKIIFTDKFRQCYSGPFKNAGTHSV